MPISPRSSLLVIVLLSSVIFAITAAGILLARKFKQYRSRPYLLSCCLCLSQSLGIGGILMMTILNGRFNAPFDTILRPATLITGSTTIIFLLAYFVDIKLPGKLTLKSFLISISPFIIVSALLVLAHPRPLHSLEELLNGIKRPDVWLRLVIVFFYFAYPIAVAFQKYEWRQCLVSRKTIAGLQILTCLNVPMFIAGMMIGYFPAIILNYVFAIILDTLIVYIEMKIRIPVTEQYEEQMSKKHADDSILDSPEIWKNPDMSVDELGRIIGTNHTYLLNRIKGLGYSSYSDMINSRRVEFICKELEKGTDVNIINLMFEAGFRSRSTANREFKRIVGYTPSEYKESVLQVKKTSRPEL